MVKEVLNMSTEIRTGWLADNTGKPFAPKTLVSQILNDKGELLENIIAENKDVITEELINYIENKLEEINNFVEDKINEHNDNANSHDQIANELVDINNDISSLQSDYNAVNNNLIDAADLISANSTNIENLNNNKISTTDIYYGLDYDGNETKVLSASAGAELNDTLADHKSDTNTHVSESDRTNWNNAHTHAGKDHAPASITSGNGISITGNADAITIGNTGILSLDIQSGDNNGCIKYKTNNNATYSEVGVKGLGSAAYKDTTYFATSHNHNDLAKQSAVDEISTKITYITSGSTSVGKANALTVTSAIGGENLPVYIDADGKPATCSQYAGGTAVTLNGAGKGGNDASFYAPTSVGAFGQILAADASGLPVWSNILDNKQDKISFTTNKGCVLVSDTNGNLATSNITSTELGYLDGVNANIQDALNGITSALGAATQGTINGNTYTGKLNGYTITYSTSPPTENNLNVITLVPR